MKTSNRLFSMLLYAAILMIFSYASCNRNNEGPGGPGAIPEVRPRGVAAGDPVSASIGTAGGELRSGDGKLLVKIPAGAVSAATVFSIQPITNTLPGGHLSAYRLLPEGTNFAKPVELVYQYTEDETVGTAVDALFLAYQKNDGVWSFMTETKLDAAARTLTVTTNHFSDWAPFALFWLNSDPKAVKAGAEAKLTIDITDTYLLAAEHKERAIGKSRLFDRSQGIGAWSLAGSGNLTVSGDKSGAIYKAPAQVSGPASVTITVELNKVIPEDTLPRRRLSEELNIYKKIRYYQETYFTAKAGNDELNLPAHYYLYQDGNLIVAGTPRNSATPGITIMMNMGPVLKSGVFPWYQDLDPGKAVLGYVLTLTDSYISTHNCDWIASPGAVAVEVVEDDGVTYVQGEFDGRVYRNRSCDDDFSLPLRGEFRVKAR